MSLPIQLTLTLLKFTDISRIVYLDFCACQNQNLHPSCLCRSPGHRAFLCFFLFPRFFLTLAAYCRVRDSPFHVAVTCALLEFSNGSPVNMGDLFESLVYSTFVQQNLMQIHDHSECMYRLSALRILFSLPISLPCADFPSPSSSQPGHT
jgi:hypothetical protein